MSSRRTQAVRNIGDGSSAIIAFKEQLNKSDFADVTFKIKIVDSQPSSSAENQQQADASDDINQQQQQQYQTIHAHRAILAARSPVFKEMFFGGFPESRQKEVVVDIDVKPEHFMTVLEWAYTGCASMSARDVLGVLQAANYYGLDDLMLECRDLAQAFIDEENVLHLLEHASGLGETSLVVQCLNFIKAHAHAVLTSPVWLGVSADCVERVLSLPAIDCEEALLFDQTMAWLEVNTTLRIDVNKSLVAHVKREQKQSIATAVKRSNAQHTANQQEKKAAAIPDDDDEKQNDDEAQQHDGDNNNNNNNDAPVSGDAPQNDDDQQLEQAAATEDQENNAAVSATPPVADTNDDDDDADNKSASSTNEDASEQQQQQHENNNNNNNNNATTPMIVDGKQQLPSAPLVKRFFHLLRLSHLSVQHLLDRVRPLLLAHPCVRPAYISALEFLVSPGHIPSVTQVPRAPTVLSSVQIDVPADFLKEGGWKLLVCIPQSSSTGLGFNQTQMIPNGFFSEVPAHAAYICVGEMVVGREDAISVVAVGRVRLVRPIIGSRTPVVAEDGDICWHASQSSFGFTPKNGDSWGRHHSSSSSNSGPVVMRPAHATPSARAQAGVRFLVATQQQSMAAMQAGSTNGASPGNLAVQDEGQRHGKKFIYFK